MDGRTNCRNIAEFSNFSGAVCTLPNFVAKFYHRLMLICKLELLKLDSLEKCLSNNQNTEYFATIPPFYYFQAGSSESTLVHYAQQQARREAESTAIRRQRNELEVALRDAEIR